MNAKWLTKIFKHNPYDLNNNCLYHEMVLFISCIQVSSNSHFCFGALPFSFTFVHIEFQLEVLFPIDCIGRMCTKGFRLVVR